ncbi:MAG: strawberry notch C-terminal domain-containing protein [Rhodobacteraceae bacterium]|nr:strawberry notch C-terminal domain-containing protein [Paracoccaceae bacterium]
MQDRTRTTTNWVEFEGSCAILRRMIRSNGEKGVLLQFTASPLAARVRQRAIDFGFREADKDDVLVLDSSDREWPVSFSKLAACLGASLVKIPTDELHSYPFTLDYRNSRFGRPIPQGIVSGAEDRRQLGRNFRNEEVFADRKGTRYRKIVSKEGAVSYDTESSKTDPTMFLRARHADDLASITASLIGMARRGLVTKEQFDTVVQAACEPAKGAESTLEPEDVAARVRDMLLRRVVDQATSDGGSRKAYHDASRLARNTVGLLDEAATGVSSFSPSVWFLIFLRRVSLGIADVEFAGLPRLAMGLPPVGSAMGSAQQVQDLFAVDAERLVERVQNTLARRDPEGLSIFIMRGSAESDSIDAVRHVAGRAHVLECVAEIQPHIATGHHDGPTVSVMFVGARRQGVDTSLHMAARRTFRVSELQDLDSLHLEIIRSRKRISEWRRTVDATDPDPVAELEENQRQRRYTPLSRLSAPFTMVPKALEGATAKSLRRAARMFETRGGVDRAVAHSLGMTGEELKIALLAEQVDAIALREVASRRRRAFLLADQTGIGKGRSLAAMARQHLRNGFSVLYFTENSEINIPDVWRDMVAVGAIAEARPVILATRPVRLQYPEDTETGERPPDCRTMSAQKRKRLYLDGDWPSNCNLLLTNYSQFRGQEDSPSRRWAQTAIDPDTMIILDESQNALNPKSNSGAALRDMINSVEPGNVVFASATPVRSQEGISLYRPLLPYSEDTHLLGTLTRQIGGSAVAQETFTTMLAEDGVLLRRDHDLSGVEFDVRLPDDARMERYQGIMDLVSQLLERVLDCSLRVASLVGRRQGVHYLELLRQGFDEATARAQTNALNQYSSMPGGLLARLARLTINAIKIDQVVEETLNEINEGRKPLITFYSTGAQLFKELAAKGRTGQTGEPLNLTLADQISRVVESIYRVRLEDEQRDAREIDERFAAMSDRINALIAALPEDLPASPIDAIHEKLAARGITTGEITGRALGYRAGQIRRQENRNRKHIVDAFNEGSIDVLLYNQAGATGGSYHAGPGFADRRPRSLIEMETPLDIIKYIQAQGRGNRYGQVASPRVVSVATGLIPEMRILQQRNRKLRILGASVDGNRSHPLLLDDVPDFLNSVGDQAAAQVLQSNHDIARRLGFWKVLGQLEQEDGFDAGSVSVEAIQGHSVSDSVANRVLSRSIVLSPQEQSRLVELIRFEFDAIIDELESRGENPLRPRDLAGEVEIHAQALFSGLESDADNLDVSAFHAPLYISTGTHHFSEEPISGDALQAMVNEARVSDGSDGFASHADIVEMNLPNALQPLLPSGVGYEEALENLGDQPYRFRKRHRRLTRLAWLLRNIKPGKVLQFDLSGFSVDSSLRTIVRLHSPDHRFADMPQAYRLQTVSPGNSRPETLALSRLVSLPDTSVRFQIGLESGSNPRHMREFARQSTINRSAPVQILSGNHLAAMQIAKNNRLGLMTLYRDTDGMTNRGIVVHRDKTDLSNLPAIVPSGSVATHLLCMAIRGELKHPLYLWTGRRDEPETMIRVARLNYSAELRGYFKFPKRILGSKQSDSERRIGEALSRGRKPCCEGMLMYPPSRAKFEAVFFNLDGFLLHTNPDLRSLINRINNDLSEGKLPRNPALPELNTDI